MMSAFARVHLLVESTGVAVIAYVLYVVLKVNDSVLPDDKVTDEYSSSSTVRVMVRSQVGASYGEIVKRLL